MNGYLIAEEGPLAGSTFAFEDEVGNEWILGRDPDAASLILEDPMVSRRHAILRITDQGFLLENLSSVNPITVNGKVVEDPLLLREGDILQIGSTFFRFSEKEPTEVEVDSEENIEQETPIETESVEEGEESRWLLKVIAGPNAGAEFLMQKNRSYVLGKDPEVCDLVFQDLSVSREHARIAIDENEQATIEDLGSRNGVIVNGSLISGQKKLQSEDLVALGTTTFVMIDRQLARETIISTAAPIPYPKLEAQSKEDALGAPKRNWKEMIIPNKHLLLAGVFGCFLIVCIALLFSLFRAEPIVMKEPDEGIRVEEVLRKYPAVQYSFNQTTGKLFVVGHVLTSVDHQELLYLLRGLPFIRSIEDSIVVDEFVWQNTNDLLSTNPDWIGVSLYATQPGKFLLRGYLRTLEEKESLTDFMNRNFSYLDRLENQVVVENELATEIQSLIIEHGFQAIAVQLSNGEVVFSGRAEEKRRHELDELLHKVKTLQGVRLVRNLIAMTSEDTSRVDLSNQYAISGFSKRDNRDFFVVIGGKILGTGDLLDGMKITHVRSNVLFLEKDGLKYKINYNLQ